MIKNNKSQFLVINISFKTLAISTSSCDKSILYNLTKKDPIDRFK